MKKTLFSLIFLLSTVLVSTENLDNNGLNYKVIEGKKVLMDTVEGKDIEAKLIELRNKLEKEFKKSVQDLEKRKSDLQAKVQARTFDQETLERENSSIEQDTKTLQLKGESAQRELERAYTNYLSKFNENLKNTVSEVAKSQGWDVVQLKESGELVYTSAKVDATDKIIKAHDTKYKAKKAVASKAQTKVESEKKQSE